VTDVSNASRTMLFDIHTLAWDNELLDLFDMPASCCPGCARRAGLRRNVDSARPGQVPIAGIAGDQQSALFGQMCRKPGMSKNTYGTGCFLLQNIGATPTTSHNQLVTTVAWQSAAAPSTRSRAACSSAARSCSGSATGSGLIRTAADIEPLALAVPDNGRRLPGAGLRGTRRAALGSVRARCHHRNHARDDGRAHRARSARELSRFRSPICSTPWLADCGIAATELRVDGGAAANRPAPCKSRPTFSAWPVVRPAVTETTALGAAYLAGLGVGFWTSADDLTGQWRVDRRFDPQMPASHGARRCGAVDRGRGSLKGLGAGNRNCRAAS
jgi:glycerol kinase